MKKQLARVFITFTLLLAWFVPASIIQIAQAAPARSDQALTASHSIGNLINLDGTLRLGSSFTGSLNLSGWNVKIDPQRGPIFNQAAKAATVPQAAGNTWTNLGSAGSSLNGPVYAIAVIGSVIYVGGTFTNADNNPSASYLVSWDGTQWQSLGASFSLDGPVYALATSGTDLYVGGSFTDISDPTSKPSNIKAADYIAKYNSLNQHWSALGNNGAPGEGALGPGSQVNAIAVSGTNVYVGGSFTNVSNNGTPLPTADYIAMWDGASWSALGHGTGSNGSLNAQVNAIAISGIHVYVGGSFTDVNNNGTLLTAADYVAEWDGANWSSLSGNGGTPVNGSIGAVVYALTVSGTDVYVGGNFTDVKDNTTLLTAADYIARWDGTNWHALGSNLTGNGSLNSAVRTILVNGTNIFAGGDFTNVTNASFISILSAAHIAQWNGSGWTNLGDNGSGGGSLNGRVSALALSGSNLVVGGGFANVHDGSTLQITADRAAIWTGAHWSGINAVPSTGALNDAVLAIAMVGSDVYVGGNFTDVNDQGTLLPAADYIARWDGSHWSALSSDGAGNGSLNGSVYALAVIGTTLYVGGAFTNVVDIGNTLAAADYIASWDTVAKSWAVLGSAASGNGALNSDVCTLAVIGQTLYAGGLFSTVANPSGVVNTAAYIAQWNGSTWSSLGDNGAGGPSTNSFVFALANDNSGDLYVGGRFTDVMNGSTPLLAADYIARWDGKNWSALGGDGATPANGSLNNQVNAIAVNGNDVYVGGGFLDVMNGSIKLTAADYIAKWDGANWSTLGDNGSGEGALNNWVNAIAVNGADVYVGGNFKGFAFGKPIQGVSYIAHWNGNNWSPLGDDGNGNSPINNAIMVLTFNGSSLYAGGVFEDVTQNGVVIKPADYVAAYTFPADTSKPTVISVTRASPNPTFASQVDFTVTFSEPVFNVDQNAFSLTASGVSGAALETISGSGNTRTVSVLTGASMGTLRLDVRDIDSVMDAAGNPLGGPGAGNGNFTTGQTYFVRQSMVYLPVVTH